MAYDLKEIKKIRKKYNLTQGELAKIAGVSQSLIAKIEAGRIDPTYSKSIKIFKALEGQALSNEAKAGDIMQTTVVSVSPNTSIRDTIQKIKRYAISQIPVIEGGNCVGSVSETAILEALLENKYDKVQEIMEDAPPIVSKNTTIGTLSDMLKYFPLLLVAEKGKIKGVVTKTDLINNL